MVNQEKLLVITNQANALCRASYYADKGIEADLPKLMQDLYKAIKSFNKDLSIYEAHAIFSCQGKYNEVIK